MSTKDWLVAFTLVMLIAASLVNKSKTMGLEKRVVALELQDEVRRVNVLEGMPVIGAQEDGE